MPPTCRVLWKMSFFEHCAGTWVFFENDMFYYPLLICLGVGMMLPLAVHASPMTALTPDVPARVFTAPTSQATAWLTSDPAPTLWVGRPGEPPRLALAGESEHFGAPVWATDGTALAVFVTPAGSQTAAWGRWWAIEVATGAAAPLIGSDSRFPDLPSVTADVPPMMAAGPRPAPPETVRPGVGRVPPATIRVAHHPLNSCRDLPAWAVTTIPFEDYVARVLPAEVYTSWPRATLEAQAIAVRTFAWRKVLLASPDATYDITDWSVDQVMCDRRYPATDAAAAATAGRYLAYGDEVILAQYSAENGHPTLDGGLPYLKPVLDPVSLGQARRGHGRGLSQWGAYRWASRYNWNAVQILLHYYTGVQVIDPFGATPSLTLLTPWPGTWLTGATAYLTAHAAFPPTATLTVTFSAPGWRKDDATGANGWAAPWPVPSEMAGPITLTASADPYTHTLTLAGVDRSLPQGNLALPPVTRSLTVTVNLNATDAGPAGVWGVALGEDWQLSAGALRRRQGAGELMLDPLATSGRALLLPAGVTGEWQGSLPVRLPANRTYRAYARVRLAPADLDLLSPLPLLHLELRDSLSGALLTFADLRAGDFRAVGVYQDFPLDFAVSAGAGGDVVVYVIGMGAAGVAFDRMQVLYSPQPFQPEILYALERRAGPQTVVARVIDRAENPSDDLRGVTQLLDVTPPGDWQLLTPNGWVTTTSAPVVRVQVADDLTGIAADSAVARFTTDAGLSWSGWLTATATIGADGLAELAFIWPGGEGNTANRLQFRVADQAGWRAVSPAWPVRVDVTPPTVELSAPAVVQPEALITLRWAGADLNGVAAFDIQVDTGRGWQDWLMATTVSGADYPAPSNGLLSVRARARDLPGNVSAWTPPRTIVVASAGQWLPLLVRGYTSTVSEGRPAP